MTPGSLKNNTDRGETEPKTKEKYPTRRLGAARHRAHELLSSPGVPDAAPQPRARDPSRRTAARARPRVHAAETAGFGRERAWLYTQGCAARR